MCVGIGTAIALGLSAAGTAMSAAASIQQGKMAEQIAERNAKLEAARGRYEAKQIGRKLRYVQGEAAVQAASNGIGLDGSFLDIVADNEVQGEIDIENTLRSSQNRADTMRFEGKVEKARARNTAVSRIIGGGSQLLRIAS